MLHVVVTSSRTWQNRDLVYQVLGAAIRSSSDGRVKITHGKAKTGGDRFAGMWADKVPNAVNDPWPADWERYGKRAGFVRNEQMADLMPHICLAFINPCNEPECPDVGEHDSHGAGMMVDLCEERDIPVEVFREPLISTGDIVVAIADINDMVRRTGRHKDHFQEKLGRCLYCSCGLRAQI